MIQTQMAALDAVQQQIALHDNQPIGTFASIYGGQWQYDHCIGTYGMPGVMVPDQESLMPFCGKHGGFLVGSDRFTKMFGGSVRMGAVLGFNTWRTDYGFDSLESAFGPCYAATHYSGWWKSGLGAIFAGYETYDADHLKTNTFSHFLLMSGREGMFKMKDLNLQGSIGGKKQVCRCNSGLICGPWWDLSLTYRHQGRANVITPGIPFTGADPAYCSTHFRTNSIHHLYVTGLFGLALDTDLWQSPTGDQGLNFHAKLGWQQRALLGRKTLVSSAKKLDINDPSWPDWFTSPIGVPINHGPRGMFVYSFGLSGNVAKGWEATAQVDGSYAKVYTNRELTYTTISGSLSVNRSF
jgi:hypothetical protein